MQYSVSKVTYKWKNTHGCTIVYLNAVFVSGSGIMGLLIGK